MESIYSDRLNEVKNKLVQYHKDIEQIIKFSQDLSKDIVKYVLNVVQTDNNLEIGRTVVEMAVSYHLTLADLMKIIVKVLYVLKNSERYKHGDYFTLKKYFDDTLAEFDTPLTKLAKKKYEMLLDSMYAADGLSDIQKQPTDKKQAIDDIKDTINRKYIKFI